MANPKKVVGGFSYDIIEAVDGCIVAKVYKNFYREATFKWYTMRSKARFEAWCGEESMAEALQAMSTHLKEKWWIQ